MHRQNMVVALVLTSLLFAAACTSKPKKEPRRYDLEGKIVAVDARMRSLTIAHKDIDGFMKAMTMEFTVKDPWVFNVAKPGDGVTAVLVMDPNGAYLENVSIVQQGTAPDASTSPVHLPEAGQQVPEFSYVTQNGEREKLSQLRGKPVLLTFIYTRCPLPDYCIRMSGNFSELEKQLKQSDPALYDRLQLLSITLDPEYDKPAVLKQYGKNYVGQVDPTFKHWQFASATPEETRQFANFFGLSYLKQEGQIVHSLRTALIGTDGKIAYLYNGNEWKPADVIRDLKAMK